MATAGKHRYGSGSGAAAVFGKNIDNAQAIGADCVLQLMTDVNVRPCCLFLVATACGPAIYKICYAKRSSKAAEFTVSARFYAAGDVANTKINIIDCYLLNRNVIVSVITGRLYRALSKDRLTEETAGLMPNAPCEMTSPGRYTLPLKPNNMLQVECVDQSMLSVRKVEVATVKQPVGTLEVAAELGSSVYSNQGAKAVSRPFRGSSNMPSVVFLAGPNPLTFASPLKSTTQG
ncbi:hypothetical protein ACP70R_032588 [Stipagrostis hirtigluma subsp. patula]